MSHLARKERSAWSVSGPVVSMILAFALLAFLLDRQALTKQERLFATQQSLQTLLAKQALADHLAGILAYSARLAQIDLVEFATSARAMTWLDKIFTVSAARSPESLAYLFSDHPEQVAHGWIQPTPGGQEARDLARRWLRAYWEQLALREEPYLVPPLHVTATAQFVGFLFPVSTAEQFYGAFVVVVDLQPALLRYLAPMRSGRYGAGYALDQQGQILYDHETQMIGRDIFDGLHADSPELMRLDRRMLSEPTGNGAYILLTPRGGQRARKLIAWNSLMVGGQKLIVCLTAPDSEVNAVLIDLRFQWLIAGGLLALGLSLMSMLFFREREQALQSSAKALQAEVYARAAKLSDTEARYRTLFESAYDAILLLAVDRIIDCNVKTLALFHCASRDQVLGDTLLDYSPPAQPAGANSELALAEHLQAALKGKPCCFEWDFCRADATSFEAEVTLNRIVLEGSFYLMAILRDITTRKQVERALRESESRFRSIFEYAPIGIEFYDVAGAMLNVNQASLEMQGIQTVKEIAAYNIFHTPMLPADMQTRIQQGQVVVDERWVNFDDIRAHKTARTSKQGHLCTSTIYAPLFFAEERRHISGYLLLIQDITTRKLAEDTIRRERDRAQTYLNIAGVLILVINVDDRVALINKRGCEMLGVTEEAILTKNWLETFLPLHERQRVRAFLHTLRADAAIGQQSIEYAIVTASGEERLIDWYATPLSDAAGRVAGILSSGRDITERQQAEARIRQLNEELEARVRARTMELQASLEKLQDTQQHLVQVEKMAALGGLVAGIAHEINTPVGVAVTAASLLDLRTKDILTHLQQNTLRRSELEQYFNTAHDSAEMLLFNLNRAADLIRSFKQVAVDETSEARRTFHLADYLEKTLISLRPNLKKTLLKVTLECPPDLQISSYPGAFSQILMNFVMNSLLHGFAPHDAGEIRIQVHVTPETLVLRYTDTGKGIPPEHLPKIFNPFFTTRRSESSMGLGLHIVYNLVTQKLGGQITCVSQVGQQTSFEITIPLTHLQEKPFARRP